MTVWQSGATSIGPFGKQLFVWFCCDRTTRQPALDRLDRAEPRFASTSSAYVVATRLRKDSVYDIAQQKSLLDTVRHAALDHHHEKQIEAGNPKPGYRVAEKTNARGRYYYTVQSELIQSVIP